MVIVQMQDPRDWNKSAPKEGDKYFHLALPVPVLETLSQSDRC